MIPGSANPLLLTGAAEAGAGYQIQRSLRFNSADSAYLSRTPASAGNRKTWSFSLWVKRSGVDITGSDVGLWSTYSGSNPATTAFFNSSGTITFYDYTTSYQFRLVTTPVYRDPSAWYHLLFVVDTTQATASDRLKLYVNGEQVTTFSTASYPSQNHDTNWNSTTEHQIGNHASYFNGYLADIHFIDGQALDPTSFGEFDDNGIWQPIVYQGTYGVNGFHLPFSDNSTNAALGTDTSGNGNDWTVNNISAVVGNGSWIPMLSPTGGGTLQAPGDAFDGNILTAAAALTPLNPNPEGLKVTFSSTITAATSFKVYAQVTSSNPGESVQFYKNGSLVVTLPNDSQGDTTTAMVYDMGAGSYSSIEVREAAAYTGNAISLYGIEVDGVFLIDYSERKNDSLVDVPTNGTETDTGVGGEVRGNYCTFNPLKELTGGYNLALSNGNLEATNGGDAVGTMSFGSGKKYFELTVQSASAFGQGYYGIVDIAKFISPRSWATSEIAALRDTGALYGDGSTGSAPAATQVGDIYGFAVDVDNQKLFISVNGAYLNGADPAAGTGASFTGRDFSNYAPLASLVVANLQVLILNAGQRPFAYTAPSGFKALCTANLPAPVVTKPSEYMDVALYTGTGSTQTVSGLSFSPDLVWGKNRTDATSHQLYDTVRGAGKVIYSNLTAAEEQPADTLSAFTSTGFTLDAAAALNASTKSFVAWTWDAGSSTVSNTDGSITSSVRANASAGFSIVTYTGNGTAGATIGHGLGVAPEMIIIKNRDAADAWQVYHAANTANPETDYLVLNTTAATADNVNRWNDTAPGASVFTLGNGAEVNTNTEDYVAYCFTGVSGYSSFGSYTGNGNADGPFVYTGFRPRWILCKQATGVDRYWQIHDAARNTYNATNIALYPDQNFVESVTGEYDFLSNGFKLRSSTSTTLNGSGETYIYAAFSEVAFNFARAR